MVESLKGGAKGEDMTSGNGQGSGSEVDNVEFPRVFPECPNCGSQKRLAQSVADELIAEGKANPDLKAWIFNHKCVIVDQSRPWLSAPVLMAVFDACYDCGTVYCVNATLGVGMPQMGGQGPRPIGRN